MLATAQGLHHDWDVSQKAVINSPASARLIVDAGPGTGKTAVACARIGYLINEEELAPTRVWMISFTRTAVAEIRNRLVGYVGHAAAGIKVATLDAQAWAIHSGYDERATLTGSFESNIERVLELVTEDEDVADYLAGIEHVVVDEAQDLVGVRADLMEAMVRRLSPQCGVTVFADEAQAIYGWADVAGSAAGASDRRDTLVKRLRAASNLSFQDAGLTKIHRTKSESLRVIFSDVRSVVLSAKETVSGLFEDVRSRIHELADRNNLSASKLGFEALPAGTLILFRRRAEVLMAAQFCRVPHSLRLSGFPRSLPPWISVCFGEFVERHVSASDFIGLWNDRVRPVLGDHFSPDDAWSALSALAGISDGSIDLHRVRNALGRSNPPVEFLDADFGLLGPILGTIHASKGREADDVLLLMPKAVEFDDEADEQEETRVLFVGSTRARNTLTVGKAIAHAGRALESGRAYRLKISSGRASAMVEIGCEEDINAEGIAGRRSSSAEDAARAQAWFLRFAAEMGNVELVRVAEADWNYRLVAIESGAKLGMLPPRFKQDLWEVANRAAAITGKKQTPPGRIKYLRALGSRSLVLRTDDPRLEQLHEPWSRSGFMLAPRLAAFGHLIL